MKRLAAAAVSALAAHLTMGCASLGDVEGQVCPVVLVPSDEIELPGQQRYRLSIEKGGALRRADAVAFRDGDAWVLVGFTPFNTRLFTLRQQGRATTVEGGALAARFGIDPVHIQDALHRAAFVRAPASGEGDRTTVWVREGERVRDSWHGEDLAERVFAPAAEAADRNASRISIEYIADPPAGASASWTVDNPDCGYQATIVMLSPGSSATGDSSTPQSGP